MRDFRMATAFLCFVAWLPMAAYGQGATAAQPTASAASPAAGPVASAPSTPAMPSDPGQLLALAAKLNGLDGPDVKPWHLKASYETFDEKGKSTGTGTYEEWWVSEKQYKRSYTSAKFNQTDYSTINGVFRSGEQKWGEAPLSLLRPLMLSPFPTPKSMIGATIKVEKRSVGNVKLQCLHFTWPIPDASLAFAGSSPGFCLGDTAPILRVTIVGNWRQVLANGITLFQGHYIPRDLQVNEDRKPLLKVHIESLTNWTDGSLEDLPSDARAVTLPISLSSQQLNALNLWKVAPHYPQASKDLKTQGTVLFDARIGIDGTVQGLATVSSPSKALTEAAEAAVRQWRYNPQLLAGEPVEMLTQIHVIFSLGP
jgi:TonB family protein